jgi:ABC-2 type transport system ATP-binding protein
VKWKTYSIPSFRATSARMPVGHPSQSSYLLPEERRVMEELPLEVSGLTKVYRKSLGIKSFTAVDSVSFNVNPGEIMGFLGPNGAGKTTTIKCMLGLLKPSDGSVALWGLRPACSRVRSRIGYVPENPDYEDSFSPMEFLGMFASMRGLDTGKPGMNALLDRVGLNGWGTTRIRNFSKGMRQRLSLALALQSKPDMLIMDEPTGGLDPIARKEFRDIILEERDRGASIFLSSHLLSEVETICDRAVILHRGRKVREGSLRELLGGAEIYRIVWTPSAGGGTVEERLDRDLVQGRIDSLRAAGADILEVREAFRSLEEVFLSATGGDAR